MLDANVFLVEETGRGNEKLTGAERVERQTHEDGDFVAFTLHHFGGDGGEEEVTAAEVDDLEACGLDFADAEDILEVFVKDVEEAVWNVTI